MWKILTILFCASQISGIAHSMDDGGQMAPFDQECFNLMDHENARIFGKTFTKAFGVGFFASVAGHPLDVVKTRQQAQASQGSTIKSAGSFFKDIWKSEGMKGFGHGLPANAVNSGLKYTLRWNMRLWVPRFLEKLGHTEEEVVLLTAQIINSTEVFSKTAMERWKVHAITAKGKDKTLRGLYNQNPEFLAFMRSMLKGTPVNYVRGSLSWTSYLWAHEKGQRFAEEIYEKRTGKIGEDLPIHYLAGVVLFESGINTLVIQPFDTIKTVLQMQDAKVHLTTPEAVYNIIKQQGLRGLYAGFGVKIGQYMVVGLLPSAVFYKMEKVVKKKYRELKSREASEDTWRANTEELSFSASTKQEK